MMLCYATFLNNCLLLLFAAISFRHHRPLATKQVGVDDRSGQDDLIVDEINHAVRHGTGSGGILRGLDTRIHRQLCPSIKR